jgi:hypothetical protein
MKSPGAITGFHEIAGLVKPSSAEWSGITSPS